jgi:hypothetical protein
MSPDELGGPAAGSPGPEGICGPPAAPARPGLPGGTARPPAEEILALMETLNRDFKKTIVMVTHDPRAAARAHVQRHLDKGVLTA